jgi:hypothetical protein
MEFHADIKIFWLEDGQVRSKYFVQFKKKMDHLKNCKKDSI